MTSLRKLLPFVVALTCFTLLVVPVVATEEITVNNTSLNDNLKDIPIEHLANATKHIMVLEAINTATYGTLAYTCHVIANYLRIYHWIRIPALYEDVEILTIGAEISGWILIGTAIIAGECYGVYKIMERDPHAFDGLEQTYNWYDYP